MIRARAALFLGAVLVAGCAKPPLEPRDPDPGSFHFTIQTYNLNNDMSGDALTLAALGQSGADIVCVQEVTAEWQDAIERRYANAYAYRMFRTDPGGGAAGLGILSRLPLRDGGWHEGPNGWHPAWHFFIDSDHGTFKIMNTHLRNATGDHGGTVQSLLTTPDDHLYEIQVFTEANTIASPTVILGDFNEGPDGAAIQFLEGSGYENLLPLFHPEQPTWRYGRTVGDQFTQEIDHILIDGSFLPLNAWVVNSGDSDHLPVVAHLEANW